LRHRLLAMRPGVRVVSYLFSMGDWEPNDLTSKDLDVAFLWIVPARVGGRWVVRPAQGSDFAPFSVELSQIYQKIGGEVAFGALRQPLLGASLHGDLVRFAFRDDKGVHQNFTGRANGRQMKGDMRAAQGESVEVTAVLEGEPHSAPWAQMEPQCQKYYGQ
jgi:hypothetical protein